jgi:hypothetical protein
MGIEVQERKRERRAVETGGFAENLGARRGCPTLLRRHVQLRASEMRVCESGINLNSEVNFGEVGFPHHRILKDKDLYQGTA